MCDLLGELRSGEAERSELLRPIVGGALRGLLLCAGMECRVSSRSGGDHLEPLLSADGSGSRVARVSRVTGPALIYGGARSRRALRAGAGHSGADGRRRCRRAPSAASAAFRAFRRVRGGRRVK